MLKKALPMLPATSTETAPSEPLALVPCETPGCQERAAISVEQPPGSGRYANLCPTCERAAHDERARAWCEAQGIRTRDDALRYMRERIARIGRSPQTVDDREPGADEAEPIEGTATVDRE